MPDYGHPLWFGTFISPTNSPAQRPVEPAQLSERLGYDFDAFQDYPYNSTLLNTWTLPSWVAARTERIGVSDDELNLPCASRQHAVDGRLAPTSHKDAPADPKRSPQRASSSPAPKPLTH
ncbi:hypothetical protein [Streptomyces sp. NPDC050255]|uniref:hypothetical protein n=1 Tax=Streptomyces sp. NPDC050255 TaxID=3365606 RepID=UPI003795791F